MRLMSYLGEWRRVDDDAGIILHWKIVPNAIDPNPVASKEYQILWWYDPSSFNELSAIRERLYVGAPEAAHRIIQRQRLGFQLVEPIASNTLLPASSYESLSELSLKHISQTTDSTLETDAFSFKAWFEGKIFPNNEKSP